MRRTVHVVLNALSVIITNADEDLCIVAIDIFSSLYLSLTLSQLVCVCVYALRLVKILVSTQNVAIPMLDWPFFCFS